MEGNEKINITTEIGDIKLRKNIPVDLLVRLDNSSGRFYIARSFSEFDRYSMCRMKSSKTKPSKCYRLGANGAANGTTPQIHPKDHSFNVKDVRVDICRCS